jgi:hypothetical protein
MKCNRLKVQFFTERFAPFKSTCLTFQPQQGTIKLKYCRTEAIQHQQLTVHYTHKTDKLKHIQYTNGTVNKLIVKLQAFNNNHVVNCVQL